MEPHGVQWTLQTDLPLFGNLNESTGHISRLFDSFNIIHSLLVIVWGKIFIPFISILKLQINSLKQTRTPTKNSDWIFDTPLDFAPASLQENSLHSFYTVSQFAGSKESIALPKLSMNCSTASGSSCCWPHKWNLLPQIYLSTHTS